VGDASTYVHKIILHTNALCEWERNRITSHKSLTRGTQYDTRDFTSGVHPAERYMLHFNTHKMLFTLFTADICIAKRGPHERARYGGGCVVEKATEKSTRIYSLIKTNCHHLGSHPHIQINYALQIRGE